MGRLLAVIGQPSSSLPWGPQFLALADGHPDGWGMSGYSGGRAVYFGRSTGSALEEKKDYQRAWEKAIEARTPVLLSHFRKSPDGQRQIGSVHPFHHRDWLFIHDGNLFKPGDLTLLDIAPQGQTDSERLLHWLMERMIPAPKPTEALREALDELHDKVTYSALSFVLTDGQQAWIHREARDQGSPLFLYRQGKMTVVSSEPLGPAAQWESVPQKKLIQIDVA